MTKTTAAKWQAIIGEQEKSGLTVREFAATRGIAAGTLFWWRSRLRRKGLSTDALVPVEVVDAVADNDNKPRVLELQVRDDIVLRLPHDFDEGALRRVLTVLGRPC